jgi:SPP1 family predicted phage head-tail adaptor
MNEILKLITVTQTTDEYGDQVAGETTREVFAKLGNIGQKEFYQAQAVGLQPELKFVLADYLDYEGEALVEYNGQRYRVLRTYRSGQELELTVYREVNPHGGA